MPPRVLSGDFSGWLRDEMAARGMTARMLALRAGVDHTTVYRLAIGERQPSLATAVAIIRVLASGRAHGPFFDESRDGADEAVEAEAGLKRSHQSPSAASNSVGQHDTGAAAKVGNIAVSAGRWRTGRSG